MNDSVSTVVEKSVSLRTRTVPIVSLALSALILSWRAWPSWNTLRGDESLLLSDALMRGVGASFQSFGGYLHLVQRFTLWVTSLFPPELFPRVIFIVSIGFWIANLALMGLVVNRLTRRPLLWLFVPVIALLPPLGIELMGDLAHVQIAMFIGIASVVVSGKFPTKTKSLNAFGIYVLLFGLSSPSIALITGWTFYRHEFPVVGSREEEVPNRIVMRYSLVALFLQLWVTTVQDDRQIAFSFGNFLEGLSFMVHGLLPQPYRDYYFDVNTNDNLLVNSILLFIVLALLICVVIYAAKSIRNDRPLSRVIEMVGFGIGSTMFYTTISDDYHTGYVAALYIFAFLGVVVAVLNLKGWQLLGARILLVVMLLGSVQSLNPRNSDDVFFGGGGWLYEELVPWNEALDIAKLECSKIPDRDIFVATNKVDSYWGVIMDCRELE